LQKLLIAEEDKLAYQLEEIERETANSRINRQQLLVET
jgi:hypothetical protein